MLFELMLLDPIVSARDCLAVTYLCVVGLANVCRRPRMQGRLFGCVHALCGGGGERVQVPSDAEPALWLCANVALVARLCGCVQDLVSRRVG